MKSEGLIHRLTHPGWRREIIWVGSSREMPSAKLKSVLHRVHFCPYRGATAQLDRSHYLLAVISLCNPDALDPEFLNSISKWPRPKPVCLIVPEMTSTEIDDAVRAIMNLASVRRIVSIPAEEHELPRALLEVLDIESIMRERTDHLSRTKIELEKQVARTRSLVKFVKEVSGANTIDHFMNVLKNEIKAFSPIKEPVLGYVNSRREPQLVFFQGLQVYEKSASSVWPLAKNLRVNDLKDSKYLANETGRPVAKLLTVPLQLRRLVGEANVEAPAAIFFEHALEKTELDAFLKYIELRKNPMSVALDRILLSQDLVEGSRLWERTFDGILDPVAILDNEGEILRANKVFFERFRDLPHEELLRDKLKVGDHYYEVQSYPIVPGREGISSHIIQHYMDVTIPHQLQKQMIQNEKMAALGNLAGHIAHELNNPLTGIRSLSQLLIEQTKDRQNLNQDLIEVEHAAERCQLIIKNLLEFSTGGVVNQQVDVSLCELIQRTLPLLKTAMGQLETEIEFIKEADTVRVEPQLMQQVIFNIIKNACQAMGAGGKFTIRTRINRRSNPALVEADFVDTGPGIAPENLNQIFDFFFTTKSPGQGTGLGLSMSKSIVDLFGGNIQVRSELGKGSCFTLSLPLVKNP